MPVPGGTPEYLAPHEPLPRGSPPSDQYIVYFRQGHSIEKHFETIGEILHGVKLQRLMYSRALTERERELVRRDPGVSKVIQSTDANARAEIRANRSLITVPHSGCAVAPGYIVMFTNTSYTIDEHFARIGQKFLAREISYVGYTADLTKSQMHAVFSDPEVECIEQNTVGTFC